MKDLCFGGSFNPVHHAHLICSRTVAEKGSFDRVRLIPSHQPPHKPHATDLASPEQRLKMCQLAVAGSSLFAVDDIELRRAGPSYTVETARELARQGMEKVHWLIGADMLRWLPNWHQPDALLREVQFVIMARPGWAFDWDTLPAKFRHLKNQVIEAPLIDISATDIRRRVRENLSIDYLTSPSVCEYIRAENLYR
jgi:nicotinate-nucleotide adenylyltransferase